MMILPNMTRKKKTKMCESTPNFWTTFQEGDLIFIFELDKNSANIAKTFTFRINMACIGMKK